MTAALLGQTDPVLFEEKQPCFQITGQSLVIFKQGKGGEPTALHQGYKVSEDKGKACTQAKNNG